jgi:phosphatidylinositol-3-phosphatase
MRKLILGSAWLAVLLVAPAQASAAGTNPCTITNESQPASSDGATVTWAWAVSCPGDTGYNVYTSAVDTTTGKAYGILGTGSPYSTSTAAATEKKKIPACVPTDLWQVKVAVRSSGGKLLAGPATTTPTSICAAPPPPPPPPPPPGAIKHIILIVEENHTLAQVTAGMPYLTGLGNTYAHATNLSAIQHPSLPNYFALTAGTTFGIGSDCGTDTSTCSQDADNIFHQADTLSGGWAGWSESMPINCDHANASPYIVHHAPAPFYTDLADCPLFDIPFTQSAPPPITAGFTFLAPNNNHNGHSGDLASADAWLQTVIPKLQADPAYQDGSTLIEITFDEGVSTNQVVPAIFINPTFAGITITDPATHYSTLRLNEELLGVPLLGSASTATDLRPQLGL